MSGSSEPPIEGGQIGASEPAPETDPVFSDSAPGPDAELAGVSTTMRSVPGEGGASRGAAVRVVVRDAEPASEDATLSRSEDEGGLSERFGEQRFWTVAALVAALVAVAVGVFFGVR